MTVGDDLPGDGIESDSGEGEGEESEERMVQDDAREAYMVRLFGLSVPPGRSRIGADAELELDGCDERIEFELKSTTHKSVSTVRDMGPDHFQKWRHRHWIVGFFAKDAVTLRHSYYASPADMSTWLTKMEQYVKPDVILSKLVREKISDADLDQIVGTAADFSIEDAKRVMKKQWKADAYRANADLQGGRYSRERMLQLVQERAEYLMTRGKTLNNPHIPESYFALHGKLITEDHQATLRSLVAAYIAQRNSQVEAGLVPEEDQIDPVIDDQASNASDTDDASE